MQISELRQQFPQLSELVYSKPLVYLDNAATALRPQSVVQKWTDISQKHNANIHRAVHYAASVATQEYESARDAVSAFINARSREEIVFTSGTTASINLLAFTFGEAFVNEGDEIVVSEAEHHSNIVPWQLMCQRKKAVLKVIPIKDDGSLDIDVLNELITEKTKLLSVAHISNVLGIINPVKDIINICHSKGCRVLIDGAQGIVHTRVDVQELDCDFYAFSGHKIYAAPGTGVLYGKKELLDQMPPYMGGGEMVGNVRWTGTTYAPLPLKFEAGTQNFASVPTFRPALEIAQQMRAQEFENQEYKIVEYLSKALSEIEGLRIYGLPEDLNKKIALFSFSVEQIHHEDLALILDKMGIAVRSGQMCAEPLMDRFGVTGMLRASFAPYNTIEEAEFFVASLKKAINMLK